MTSEGLWEMFEGDSADMCAGKFPLMSMGGRAEGLACADPGVRTPIGVNGICYLSCINNMRLSFTLIYLKNGIVFHLLKNCIKTLRKVIQGHHVFTGCTFSSFSKIPVVVLLSHDPHLQHFEGPNWKFDLLDCPRPALLKYNVVSKFCCISFFRRSYRPANWKLCSIHIYHIHLYIMII